MPTLTADEPDTATHAAYHGPSFSTDSDVVELPLLLPRWQVDALEEAANRSGMTTGQMIRRVISDLFRKPR